MRRPWQFKVTLTRSGQDYIVDNPTSHHIIINDTSTQRRGPAAAGFKPLVIPPRASQPLKAKMVSAPVLTYIDDYGARMSLIFRCEGNTCEVDENQGSKG